MRYDTLVVSVMFKEHWQIFTEFEKQEYAQQLIQNFRSELLQQLRLHQQKW